MKALLTEQEAAEYLGVSMRSFHSLRSQPWMPKPVVLGPRTMRWVRAELIEAIASMPRQESIGPEPEALKSARRA